MTAVFHTAEVSGLLSLLLSAKEVSSPLIFCLRLFFSPPNIFIVYLQT